MTQSKTGNAKFVIFRSAEAVDFDESGVMKTLPLSEIEMEGSIAAVGAGMLAGANVRLLFESPALTLTHAWFKSGFPLPRHSHNVDCLYYITAGSLRLGTETLAKGDGFFVGADVPYAYTPGPEGVEVLEFRATNDFDIRLLANNRAFWTKAVDHAAAKQGAWANEQPPVA
jgi:hypothetical protein